MGFLDSIKTSLENFAKEAFKSREERVREALANIEDPIAKEISWDPLKPGGSSFKTNVLIENMDGSLEYKISAGARIFSGVFFIFPLIFMFFIIAGSISDFNNSGFDLVALIISIMIPGILMIVGIYLYRTFSKPIIFDKSSGYLYFGKRKDNFGMIESASNDMIQLRNIYAVQLLSEYLSSNKSGYYSYELNIVLQDKTRINIIDHGNLEAIINDAQKISSFLRVPLWDLSNLNIN